MPLGSLGGLSFSGGIVFYEEGPNDVKEFAPTTGGNYQAAWYVLDRLFYNSTTGEYTLTKTDGRVLVFDSSGRLISFRDAGGNAGTVAYDGAGDLDTVTVSDGTNSWQLAYDWNAGGNVESIILSVDSRAVRKSVYSYNASGNLVTVKTYSNSAAAGFPADWGTQTVSAERFSYHGVSADGLLKCVLTPVNYRQMVNNGLNPDTAPESDLEQYAETEYAYNGSGQVATMYTHGRLYTRTFEYFTQSQVSTSLNVWTNKTVVTLPDTWKRIFYFNRGGEVILKQVTDSLISPTQTWNEVYQQFEEDTGRVTLEADAAAINSVSEGSPGLVTLKSTEGRVKQFVYNANGRLFYTSLKKGSGGAASRQEEYTYTSRSVSGLGTIYVPATRKVYRADGGADAVTTSYSYTWYTGTFQMSQRVTTLPVVVTGENGTGTAVTRTENFDQWGYLTSSADGSGAVTAYQYNRAKGGMTQKIVDQGVGVNFLNLTTTYELDDLGRTVLELGPAHDISLNGGASVNIRRAQWTYYKDREGEVWNFGGYQRTSNLSNQIVGPVSIYRPNTAAPAGSPPGSRQDSRIDAVYSSAGIPTPATTFSQSTWARWTLELYSKADQKTEEWSYFVIPSSGYGVQSTNYGKKLFAYDSMGRLSQTTCAGGTVDKTTFNAMGWAVQEELGTSAGLTVTEVKEYYPNGTLKKRTLPVDATAANDRVTDYTWDYRQRLVQEQTTVEKDGGGTWTLFTAYGYDNRDLRTSVTNYHTSVADSNRTGHSTEAYDALGRSYRSVTYAVDITGSATPGALGNALTDNRFYDKEGRIARSTPSGSTLATVTQYDAAGRVSAVYQATGTFSSSDPASVANAAVVEQTEYANDAAGNRISATLKQRFDSAAGNGPLGTPTTGVLARVSYTAYYADALGREIAAADYGTNGAAAWSRSATVPARSNTVLVTTTGYSTAGNVSSTVDPAGRQICRTWDDADRLTVITENCQSGSSSSSSSGGGLATDVRTTRYEYTDDGWLKKLKSDNAATTQQVTEWVYGVTPAQGSALYSNRLVYQKKYPDTAGGTDLVSYKYNRQQQITAMTDQAGTAHTYAFDKLGRFLSDTVTFPGGTALDTTVNKLDNAYNERGLLVRAASYNTSGGAKRNEVKWDYNSFNQPVTEYQEHGGAVNPGTSLKVQYAYANGSANTIRPTGMTYPGPATPSAVTYDYLSTLASALSRPDAVKEGLTTLASYRYLGLNTLVNLKYDAASNTELTMQNGGTGDAGDIYTGLDRFGRLVETIWQTGAAKKVHTSYVRNRVGGVTWKKDVLASTLQDHAYTYDGLQQLIQHRRGTLTGTAPNYTGVTSLQQNEIFSFDETGNWLSNSTTSPALSQTRTHNKANEITNLTGPASVIDPVYDPAGNTTTMPKPGDWLTGYTLKWDAWNRLAEIRQGVTLISSHVYDALTRRVSKTTPSETRDYYYDKEWRCLEERVLGAVKAQYTWSPGDRWTLIRRRRSVSGTLDQAHFVLKDYLDPAAIINSVTGAVEERYSYDAFGPVQFLNPSFGAIVGSAYGWDFLFHAEFMDTESGLYNYGYRFYHPYLGRWTSRDPIGERGRTKHIQLLEQFPYYSNRYFR